MSPLSHFSTATAVCHTRSFSWQPGFDAHPAENRPAGNMKHGGVRVRCGRRAIDVLEATEYSRPLNLHSKAWRKDDMNSAEGGLNLHLDEPGGQVGVAQINLDATENRHDTQTERHVPPADSLGAAEDRDHFATGGCRARRNVQNGGCCHFGGGESKVAGKRRQLLRGLRAVGKGDPFFERVHIHFTLGEAIRQQGDGPFSVGCRRRRSTGLQLLVVCHGPKPITPVGVRSSTALGWAEKQSQSPIV